MEALKLEKKISSNKLIIDGLEKYIGLDAEIIILPMPQKSEPEKEIILNLAGVLQSKKDGLDFQREIRNEWSK